MIDRQSMETDPEKRRRLVWDIERKLIEDDVRPGGSFAGLQPSASSLSISGGADP